MYKHIVLWKLKEHANGAAAEENGKRIKENLEGLVGQIDGLVSLEVGLVPGNPRFDVCMLGRFLDRDALKFYLEHPLHKEKAAFTMSVVEDRMIIGFDSAT